VKYRYQCTFNDTFCFQIPLPLHNWKSSCSYLFLSSLKNYKDLILRSYHENMYDYRQNLHDMSGDCLYRLSNEWMANIVYNSCGFHFSGEDVRLHLLEREAFRLRKMVFASWSMSQQLFWLEKIHYTFCISYIIYYSQIYSPSVTQDPSIASSQLGGRSINISSGKHSVRNIIFGVISVLK